MNFLERLVSDLQEPFFDAYSGAITIDDAVEKAAYNMMLSYLKDWMAKAALRNSLSAFFFSGPIGTIVTWGLSYLVAEIARGGSNFAIGLVHKWHVEKLRKIYEGNMIVYHQQIDVNEVLTEAQKEKYKRSIKNELKEFWNLARFFKPK